MRRLRVAVIGAGNIAQEHLKVLRDRPDCEIAVLCDRNEAVLAATAERFGIGATETSAEAVGRRDDLDGVFALVTHTATVPVVCRFLEAGIPTFLEKPPGLFSDDTARLAELQARTGTLAMVGFNRRFYATHLEARATLLAHGSPATLSFEAHEDLTRMTTSRFTPAEVPLLQRRRPYANSIHCLDLIRYFGGEVAAVHPFHARYEWDFPDSYSAVLEFASGATGRVLMDFCGPGSHRFLLRGVGLTLTSDPGFGGVTVARRRADDSRGPETWRLEPDEDDRRYKAGFWKQAGVFLAGAREGRQPEFPAVTLVDAVGTMRLIDRICDSASLDV